MFRGDRLKSVEDDEESHSEVALGEHWAEGERLLCGSFGLIPCRLGSRKMVHRGQGVSHRECCPGSSGFRLLVEHRSKALLRFLNGFTVVLKQIVAPLKHQSMNARLRK